jgi:hypothetical protein
MTRGGGDNGVSQAKYSQNANGYKKNGGLLITKQF